MPCVKYLVPTSLITEIISEVTLFSCLAHGSTMRKRNCMRDLKAHNLSPLVTYSRRVKMTKLLLQSANKNKLYEFILIISIT